MSVRGPGLFLRRVLGTNTASGMGTRFCGGRSTPLGRSAKLSGGAVCRNCSLNVCRDLSLLEVGGNECPSAPGIVAKSSFFSRAFVLGEWRSMPITTAQLLQARDKQRDVRCRIAGPCAAARPPHSLLPHLGLRGKSKNVIASICSIPSARCGAFVA